MSESVLVLFWYLEMVFGFQRPSCYYTLLYAHNLPEGSPRDYGDPMFPRRYPLRVIE